MAIIFHITTRDAWAGCEAWSREDARAGYRTATFSIEGFIHCSTREQVVQVANRRFRGQAGLVLLAIDTDKVVAEIRYENLEGGHELFPHIYGEISTDAVVQVAEFKPGVAGYFEMMSLPDS